MTLHHAQQASKNEPSPFFHPWQRIHRCMDDDVLLSSHHHRTMPVVVIISIPRSEGEKLLRGE
jgi:hypothetical protein